MPTLFPGGPGCPYHKLIRNCNEDSAELPLRFPQKVRTLGRLSLLQCSSAADFLKKISTLLFFPRCGSKQGEEDYRPLFENFVQDLLSTVNKPEWPAAELLLSLLGRLLVSAYCLYRAGQMTSTKDRKICVQVNLIRRLLCRPANLDNNKCV